MDPLTLGIVVMVGMLVVVMLGLPVGYALLGAGTIGYAVLSGPSQAFTQIGLALWDNGTNFLFIAVPLFILMGQLIFHAGLAEDIFALAQRALRACPAGWEYPRCWHPPASARSPAPVWLRWPRWATSPCRK